MQVVLTTDFPGLGRKGRVVSVKAGYFRNFLMPRSVAKIASNDDLKAYEQEEELRNQKRQEMLNQAAELLEKLNGATVELSGKASAKGSLYAQIHDLDIAKALEEKFAVAVEASDVVLKKHVKKTGDYEFAVRLSPNHVAMMKLVVKAEVE